MTSAAAEGFTIPKPRYKAADSFRTRQAGAEAGEDFPVHDEFADTALDRPVVTLPDPSPPNQRPSRWVLGIATCTAIVATLAAALLMLR